MNVTLLSIHYRFFDHSTSTFADRVTIESVERGIVTDEVMFEEQ